MASFKGKVVWILQMEILLMDNGLKEKKMVQASGKVQRVIIM